MTLDGIRAAYMARLQSWADAPVAFDNSYTPPSVKAAQTNGDPWIYVSFQNGDSQLAQLDDTDWKTGLLQIQVLTGMNVGEKPANAIADSLITHLAHYRDGKLKTRQANVTRVGQANEYYRINLSFPFVAY